MALLDHHTAADEEEVAPQTRRARGWLVAAVVAAVLAAGAFAAFGPTPGDTEVIDGTRCEHEITRQLQNLGYIPKAPGVDREAVTAELANRGLIPKEALPGC